MARRLALVVALAGASCSSPQAPPVPRPLRAPGTTPAPPPSATSSVVAAPATSSTTAAIALVPPSAPGGEAARPVDQPRSGAGGAIEETLACIRQWESGGGVPGAADYAIASGAGHLGAYQFAPSTWRGAVARAGYGEWADRPANEAPPAVQDAAAAQLLAERGLQPWPTPSRLCA